jgi:iron complex transport system ATP-binding protein
MMRKEYISVNNATLGYRKPGSDVKILAGLDLRFFSGDFIGVVGLNGVGKSTLLKSICGLLPVVQGEILIDKVPISEIPLTELAKKIAIVLTEKIGGFNLTAHDVVAAGQIPYTNAFHQLTRENELIIESAINRCGIASHQHKLLNELSDGLFQKTIIAKALAQQTPVMLLDEPSAFLDYASKHDLFLLLKRLSEEENKCILLSSHDLDLVLRYCNRLLVVSAEKAELIPVSEAKTNEAFLQIGGGFI